MQNCNLSEIAAHFNIYSSIEPYGDGHINDTYLTQQPTRFILQKINSSVFHSPQQVMHNIVLVTRHISKKLSHKNPSDKTLCLELIDTFEGKPYYKTDDGQYFRMYKFIENAISYSKATDTKTFYNAAKGFGRFFNLLSDFDSSLLYETIKNFHHTPSRFAAFKDAVSRDVCGRAQNVRDEIYAYLSREKMAYVVTDKIADGSVLVRVTHNDTKLNNIMLDSKTGEPICVIDLDTVMPGSILYDFGDSIRFGASSAAEDEKNLDKVYCDLELFDAFCKGFLEETASILTETEKELLSFSARLLTYECGMRFLTDYLNGDTYFKIHFEDQNLCRARTQLKLVCDMEKKETEMKSIVKKYL